MSIVMDLYFIIFQILLFYIIIIIYNIKHRYKIYIFKDYKTTVSYNINKLNINIIFYETNFPILFKIPTKNVCILIEIND